MSNVRGCQDDRELGRFLQMMDADGETTAMEKPGTYRAALFRVN